MEKGLLLFLRKRHEKVGVFLLLQQQQQQQQGQPNQQSAKLESPVLFCTHISQGLSLFGVGGREPQQAENPRSLSRFA